MNEAKKGGRDEGLAEAKLVLIGRGVAQAALRESLLEVLGTS